MFGHTKTNEQHETANSGFRAFLRDFLEGFMQGFELLQQLKQQQAANVPGAFGLVSPCLFDDPPVYQPFVIDGALMLVKAGPEQMGLVHRLEAEIIPPTEAGWIRFLELAVGSDQPTFHLADAAQSWFGRPLGGYVDYHRTQARIHARQRAEAEMAAKDCATCR